MDSQESPQPGGWHGRLKVSAVIVVVALALIIGRLIVVWSVTEPSYAPALRGIAEAAESVHKQQVPLAWAILRYVTRDITKCADGRYVVVFDVYRLWDKVIGFARYDEALGVIGGGVTIDPENSGLHCPDPRGEEKGKRP